MIVAYAYYVKIVVLLYYKKIFYAKVTYLVF